MEEVARQRRRQALRLLYMFVSPPRRSSSPVSHESRPRPCRPIPSSIRSPDRLLTLRNGPWIDRQRRGLGGIRLPRHQGPRAGILKALTADFEDFHQQCDPAKENLCLYGFPDEHWEVNLPADEVPPEIPEPVLGINFARDGTNKKDWLSLVAIHSDAWLNALASYFGGRFQFDRTQSTDMWILGTYLCRRRICPQHSWTCVLRPSATSLSSDRPFFLTFCCCFARKHLSVMIADLPTLCEVVSEMNLQRVSGSKHSSNKSKSNSKLRASSEHQAKKSKSKHIKEEVEDLNGNDNNDDEDKHLCASCGGNDSVGDYFWICCDACEKWYHGKCVRVTPAKAKHIKDYCCPRCSHSKRRRISKGHICQKPL